MHILIAEDNEANRLLVQSLLEREGHKLCFAENGLAALQLCKDTKYDLILMDIMMPLMDGVKALRKLKRSGGHNGSTPVFALTGYSSAADRRRYRQVGFDLVLAKPLKPGDIHKAWESYLTGDTTISPPQETLSPEDYSATALIDEVMIKQLLQAGSLVDVQHIINSFWISARQFISQIKQDMTPAITGDADALQGLRKAAHGLKGSAATLGLARFSKVAANLQNAPPEKITSLVTALLKTLKESGAALEQSIQAYRSKHGSLATRFGDANAPTISTQNQPLPSLSPSPHKKSAVGARLQQE